MTSHRCLGITQSGNQCRRHIDNSEEIYCWQHQSQNPSPFDQPSIRVYSPKQSCPQRECSICYSEPSYTLGCNHPVCPECLKRMRKAECPVCRRDMTIQQDDGSLLAGILQRQWNDEEIDEARNRLAAMAISNGLSPTNAYSLYRM